MIACLHYKAQGIARNRVLLIMLPGAGIEVAEFALHSMVAALHECGLAADIVAKAGSLASWSAERSVAEETERTMLVWLQNFIVHRPSSPALYLGYEWSDCFAPGHRMLAEHLLDDIIVTAEGGHDWGTWLLLWQRILDRSSFMAEVDETACP